MSIIYYASPRLDRETRENPICVRGYDKAGNLLSCVRRGGRWEPDSIDVSQWLDAINGRYHVTYTVNYTALDVYGEPFSCWNTFDYWSTSGYLDYTGQLDIDRHYEWKPGALAANSDGRLFIASAYITSADDNELRVTGLDPEATYFRDGAADFIRVFTREGYRVPFPQLHGAQITHIQIGSDDAIYVGGRAAAADNCFLRAYDKDGALLWSVSDSATSDNRCRALHVSSTGVYVSWSGYYSGYVALYSFIAKYSFAGAKLWERRDTTSGEDVLGEAYQIVDPEDGYVYVTQGNIISGVETILTKYNASTGAVTAGAPFFSTYSGPLAAAVNGGYVHVVTPSVSGQPDYLKFSTSDLSLVDSQTWGHGLTWDVGLPALDTDGVLYTGSRRLSTVIKDVQVGVSWHVYYARNAFHFTARDASGANPWYSLTATGAAGVHELDGSPRDDASEHSAQTYLPYVYLSAYGVDAGPDNIYFRVDDPYSLPTWEVENWSFATVTITPGAATPGIPVPLGLGVISWIGDTYTAAQGIAILLGVSAPFFRREYASALRLPDAYLLVLTGSPDIEIPLSSIQVRRDQAGTLLSITSPSASAALIAEILARPSGELVLSRGVRFSTGETQVEEMIRVPLSSVRYDAGGSSGSISLSGKIAAAATISRPRTLAGVSYRSISGGKRRARCAVDTYLSPGDTAILAPGDEMVVGSVVCLISPGLASMEVVEL